MANKEKARHLSRFFKTEPGAYGEGDKFLGIAVPQTRSVVKRYRSEITLSDLDALIKSEWHEIRLAGFLLLVELYRKAGSPEHTKHIVDFYVDRIPYGNNWDLVDLVCYNLLGDWLLRNPDHRPVLDRFATMESLWHQRVSIVATMALVRAGEFGATLRIARLLLNHPHDLIHKAVGWLLREVGKRDEPTLIDFLDTYCTSMSRTTLRYAVERLSTDLRRHYMTVR